MNITIFIHDIVDVFNTSPVLSDPPDAPEAPEVSDVSKSSMNVSWDEPNNGGDAIIGYWLEKKDTRTTRWGRVARERIRDLSYQVGVCGYTLVIQFLTLKHYRYRQILLKV